ncbi:ABC transporter ATP-binding protein [Anaerolinea sp.]|uniref:ABC transporter ATP-binding protein n=1 Tax=Anaerolinea sp. TaxID=1872519 RepID=UPI002ACE185B|nr:ATP-binding cassette domain-containing protein [Anaerolinea sp.]
MQSGNSHVVISAKGITRRFGKRLVLDNLDFELPAGQIYGISGPNGSGKSVFLRILTGLVLPNQGEVRVFDQRIGKDVEFPASTGALIDRPGFLPHSSGFRNLELLARIRGFATPTKISETMYFVGLDPHDPKPVGTYSTGMRQRLGFAQAIMEDPDLLILDEPTNGLDFDGQREIYSHLVELRRQGKTILLTSHNREELRILCDAIWIMQNGRLQPSADEVETDWITATTTYRES